MQRAVNSLSSFHELNLTHSGNVVKYESRNIVLAILYPYNRDYNIVLF